MAGILKVDQYQDFNGNNIMTSDGSGNLTLNNSALKMTPAFEAYGSAHMTGVADAVWTKLTMNTEKFDTDSMYDSSTNYRFTPTISGKYHVYGMCTMYSETNYKLNVANVAIYKNGSVYKVMNNTFDPSYEPNENTLFVGAVVDFNGSSDYVELYARSNVTSGTSTLDIDEGSGTFGAYKIIGA
jgi:hypothetical protein